MVFLMNTSSRSTQCKETKDERDEIMEYLRKIQEEIDRLEIENEQQRKEIERQEKDIENQRDIINKLGL